MVRWLLGFALLTLAAPAFASDVTMSNRVEADGTTTQVHEITIPAPPEAVWQAITTPEGWMTWAVPLARWVPDEPGVLETSYDTAAEPGGPATIRQRFLFTAPGYVLAFRTIKAPEGFPYWEDYARVLSLFELEPVGTATRVRLTAAGYPDNEGGRALLGFFAQGNAETLEKLRAAFAAE